MRRVMGKFGRFVFWGAWPLFLGTSALAQHNVAVIKGNITDEKLQIPLESVTVTAISPSLQGKTTVTSDDQGLYRLPNLPPGVYRIQAKKEGYLPFAQDQLQVPGDTTLRLNIELRPEKDVDVQEVVVTATGPTVDIGSTQTTTKITSDFTDRVPVSMPTSKGATNRSIESVAAVAPQATGDSFGTSVSGTTSPENSYVVDGLSVGDTAFGIIGTPFSMEFVKQLNVITSGYMPEYGRTTGGVISAASKSGSNEFHGSAWFNVTPGGLEGDRKTVKSEVSTIVTEPKLSLIYDVGADVGGYLMKDKLWFYVGVDYADISYTLKRSLWRTLYDAEFNPLQNADGTTRKELIPGTTKNWDAASHSLQVFSKLTYTLSENHRFNLSFTAAPTFTGGRKEYSIDPQTGAYPTALRGTITAINNKLDSDIFDTALTWHATRDDKKLLFETTVGWHYQHGGTFPIDDSPVGSSSGLAGIPRARWMRSNPNEHSITEFETLPDPTLCDPPAGAPEGLVPCGVDTYYTGGPGYIDENTIQRVQGRTMATWLQKFYGSHELKAGVDLELTTYADKRAYSGERYLSETTSGAWFYELRDFGTLVGPDDWMFYSDLDHLSKSLMVGGFLQDSWSVLDKVTVNLGLRYDSQYMFNNTNDLTITLPNQWSPRIGVIYDPLQNGRSKIYANFGIFFEAVPLDIINRGGSGEPSGYHYVRATPATCDPSAANPSEAACYDETQQRVVNDPPNPNQIWKDSNGLVPIDPDLSPQSSSELVLGGEYEFYKLTRVGLTYTRRWMNSVIEDMSRDEAQTYFIGNPGSGIAKDFPEAERTYDAMTLFLIRNFGENWLAQASYTLAHLRGNYVGLFRPETLQIDPNANSDFDLQSLTVNREGPLPGDNRHNIKIYGAYDYKPFKDMALIAGMGFNMHSGGPTNVLGAHVLYGTDEVFILPRGAGERLPWFYRFDLHLGYNVKLGPNYTIGVTADIFNVFNLQGTTGIDERYTASEIQPILKGNLSGLENGTLVLNNTDNEPLPEEEKNKNFGKPNAYQEPLSVRFGIRGTF